MGRPKSVNTFLPNGVHRIVKSNGKTYYYFQLARGTQAETKRIPLGTDPLHPDFWRKLGAAQDGNAYGGSVPAKPKESWAEMIAEYRVSPDWDRLRVRTQKDYASYLNTLLEICGERSVRDLTKAGIYQLRDSMSKTPVAANHMVSIMRTIVEWGIPRGYRDDNPAIGIKALKKDDSGAEPWPDEGYNFVLKHAPEDLRRMAYLGRACGQRREDLVLMRGVDLVQDGINLLIGKLRDRKHFVPLTREQVRELRSWRVGELDFFLKSTTGKRFSGDHLNSRWNRWRESDAATPIRHLKMTIHGLRATAIADRREAGTEDGAIADELGLSVAMVSRYLRFADKARSARASRDRREKRLADN